MIDLLFTALKYSGAVTLFFLTIEVERVNSTEYVFSAPPEVDNNVVEEIPAREDDYPLYECNIETSEKEEIAAEDDDNNSKIDSHDCDCVDCEETSQEEPKTKLSSNNRQKK